MTEVRRRGRRAGLASLISLVLGRAGSENDAGGPADSPVEVIRRDSADVEIVETPVQMARSPSSVTVRAEPEFEIGELDGDAA